MVKGRPSKIRTISSQPAVLWFNPEVSSRDVQEVWLALDQLEAVKLADYLGFSHKEGSEKMGISRATFGRVLGKARKVIAQALVDGKTIKIAGGNILIKK